MKTTIIAEVGECFNGDMSTANTMIKEAKKAGCDIVKFQLLDMTEVAEDDPEREWFAKLNLAPPRLQQLIAWAKENNIDILFTPVSVRTAEWLIEEGINKVKIASSFLRKRELLDFIARHFDIVYASTGMASLDDVHELLDILKNVEEVKLLHCISEYPTGPLLAERGLTAMNEEDAHLNMISILKKEFPNQQVGYSDHTAGTFVPAIAVAHGATIIEKHFTMDRLTPVERYNKGLEYMGTDHVLSAEPDELKEMVTTIRRIERICGSEEWDRSNGEKILIDFLRGRYIKR